MTRRGFTIVELIIAISLVLLLAGLMIPVGARLATSRERLDAEVRRLEQVGRLFDVLESSLATCGVDDVAIQGSTLNWIERAARPGAEDWQEAIGIGRPMSLQLSEESLQLGAAVDGVTVESVVVLGIDRVQFRSIASRAGEVAVQIWFADVTALSESTASRETESEFDEFGLARAPAVPNDLDVDVAQEQPREADVERVFRLRVEKVSIEEGA